MASLFKRYHSTEEYYDIERRMRAPWWGRPFNGLVNSVMRLAGTPAPAVPEGKIAIDMHVHTYCSYCSFTRPGELLQKACRLGLRGICVMDHHTTLGYRLTAELAEKLKEQGALPRDFIVLKGIEYSTAEGHICGLFCSGDIPFREVSAQEAVDRILDMGGLPIAAHPFHKTGVRDRLYSLKRLAGVEIYSGSVLREQEYLQAARINTDACRLGSSDSHFVNTCGMCYTLFPEEVRTEEDIRQAMLSALTEACETPFYTALRRLYRGMK